MIHFSPPNGLLQRIPGVVVIRIRGVSMTINASNPTNGIRLQTRSQSAPVLLTTTSINSIHAVRFTTLSRFPMTGKTPSQIRSFIKGQIYSIPTEIFMAI